VDRYSRCRATAPRRWPGRRLQRASASTAKQRSEDRAARACPHRTMPHRLGRLAPGPGTPPGPDPLVSARRCRCRRCSPGCRPGPPPA
jgi:hypothetical protein